MRIDPVCLHIAKILNCNVCLYDTKGLAETYCSRVGFSDIYMNNQTISECLLESKIDLFPTIYCFNKKIIYIRFAIPDGFCLIGPVKLSFCEDPSLFRMSIACEEFNSDTDDSLSEVFLVDLLTYSLLLYNIYQEQDLELRDCFQMNYQTEESSRELRRTAVQTMFINQETQQRHNPYDQEQRMLMSIELGNIRQLKASWAETYPGALGVTSKDPIRNGKNHALYVICASARAAIRGGMQPEYVMTLTDTYSQRVEELKDKDMFLLESIVNEVQMILTQMVYQLRTASRSTHIQQDRSQSPIITQCKDYVFTHLHSKLTVQEIADALHVHPNYLSNLFRKQEGDSLYQFVLAQKLNQVKSLLIYSDLSFGEIASYLGFASQSHLGTQFKKFTGMTLREYRTANRYCKVEE